MSKSIMICFRTSEGLRDSLEVIATEEKRSISSTIENILHMHLDEENHQKPLQQENRRYPRKKLSAPALIRKLASENTPQQAAIVVDVSLNGLQISISDNCQYDVQQDKENTRISIIFTLPDCDRAITMHCLPKRIYPSGCNTRIGATIVDTDFASYQELQNYLVH